MPDAYEQTVQNLKLSMRETDAGKLLVRYGFEPIDAESAARRVAEKAAEDIAKLTAALQKVAQWELPPSGLFYDQEKKEPMSYGAAFGSSGERVYMRKVARDALALTS